MPTPAVSANSELPLGTIGGEGLGPFGKVSEELSGSAELGLEKVAGVISSIIGVMTIAAAIWFLFQFLVGGLHWSTSGGDKAKLESAKGRITHAFIGLIIVIAGWAIIALTGQFFDIDVLLSKPETILQPLTP